MKIGDRHYTVIGYICINDTHTKEDIYAVSQGKCN